MSQPRDPAVKPDGDVDTANVCKDNTSGSPTNASQLGYTDPFTLTSSVSTDKAAAPGVCVDASVLPAESVNSGCTLPLTPSNSEKTVTEALSDVNGDTAGAGAGASETTNKPVEPGCTDPFTLSNLEPAASSTVAMIGDSAAKESSMNTGTVSTARVSTVGADLIVDQQHPAVEQRLSHGSATTVSSYEDVFFPVQRKDNPDNSNTTVSNPVINIHQDTSAIDASNNYKDTRSTSIPQTSNKPARNKPYFQSQDQSHHQQSHPHANSLPNLADCENTDIPSSFRSLLETSRAIASKHSNSNSQRKYRAAGVSNTASTPFADIPAQSTSLKLGSPVPSTTHGSNIKSQANNHKNGSSAASAPILSGGLTRGAVSKISKGSTHTGVKRMASSRSLSKLFSTSSLTVLHDSPARTNGIYEEARPGSHTPPSPRKGSLTVMSPLMLTRKNSLEVHGSPNALCRRNSLEVPLDRRMSVEFRPTDLDKRVERTSLSGEDLFTSIGDDHTQSRRTSSPSLLLDHNIAHSSAVTLPQISNGNIMSMDLKAVSAIREARSSLSMSSRDSLTSVGSASSLGNVNMEHSAVNVPTMVSPRDTRLPAANYKRTHSDSESSSTGPLSKRRHLSKSANGTTSYLAGLTGMTGVSITGTRPEKLIVTYNDEESGATVTKDVEEDVEDIVLPCPKRSSSIVSEHGDKPLRKFSVGRAPTTPRLNSDTMSIILSTDDDGEEVESGEKKRSTVTIL